MSQNSSDPDLSLQSFNDHGIYTMEELSSIVKPQFTAVHLNIRSLSQHFLEM